MKLRCLPPAVGEPVPGIVIYKHYNLGEHTGLKGGGNITCFKTWKQYCPICAVLDEYKDRVKLEDFFGSSSYFNVLILGNSKYDPTLPYILQASAYNYEWVLQQLVNIEVGDITDAGAGANVTFIRKVQKGTFKGSFDRTISRKSSPIADDPDKIDEILDNMYDLKKIWREPDDSYLAIAEELAERLRGIIEKRLVDLKNKDNAKEEPVREVADAKRSRVDKTRGEDKGIETQSEEDILPKPESNVRRRRAATADGEEEKKEVLPSEVGRRRPAPVSEPEPEIPEKEPEPEIVKESEKSNTGVNKKASNKPSKAPDCFGVEHSTGRKCQICQFEYDCENAPV
jgi:hypothetical protein